MPPAEHDRRADFLGQGLVPILSRPMLSWLRRAAVMNNEADGLVDLEAVLARAFPRWDQTVRGMVGIFAGWKRTAEVRRDQSFNAAAPA
jgi:hypothetical protein